MKDLFLYQIGCYTCRITYLSDVSISLWVNIRSMIAGSYGKGVFGFVGSPRTVFQSGCAISIPTSKDEISIAPHPSFALGVVSVLDLALLSAV